MLIELYIFFVRQYHQVSTVSHQIVTRYSCYGNVRIVWVCVYNRQVQQRLSTGQKLNVSWILESLHGGSGTRSQKGVAPPPPPLSFLVQLGKQSLGVVHYLAVTTTLSVFYHWAEVESQCRRERFLPWLGFSSAKLQTSGLQLRGQSAYSVSQRPNWTQTWS